MQFKLSEARLENGLTIVHAAVPADDMALIANVNTGSLYESDSTAGLSHLVEHLLFSGTTRRPSRDAIENELDLLGGKNECYTSKANVALEIRVALEDFEQTLDLIADLFYRSRMDERDIEKEKNRILDELRCASDDPYEQLVGTFEDTLYHGCELALSEAGSEETVRALTADQIVNFYQEMFCAANTTLFIVGPKPFSEVVGKVKSYFASARQGCVHPIPEIKVPENSAKKVFIKRELKDAHLMIGKIVPSARHKDAYALMILSQIMARRVFDKALGYTVYVDYEANRFVGSLVAYATCAPQNYLSTVKLIRHEFYGKKKIPEDHIRDAISFKKKAFVLNNETTLDKARTLLKFWLDGDVYAVNGHLRRLEQLTVEEIRSAASRYLCADDLTEIYLSPESV